MASEGCLEILSLVPPWIRTSLIADFALFSLSWNKLGDETAKELAMVLPGMIRMKILE